MYVEAYSGDDAVGTGEKDSPVASLAEALEVVTEKTNASPGKYEDAKIIMGDGLYEVTEPISIDSTVSYPSGGLTIEAADGAEPTLIGGVAYALSEAQRVTDTAVLSRLHSESAKENLYAIDLTTKIALSDIPAVSHPGAYSVRPWLIQLGLDNPADVTCEASFDGSLMTVARYPNTGYALTGAVSDVGIEARYMLESYDGTENDLDVTEENLLKGIEFASSYENLSKWQSADQALMFGYWYYDWATQTIPLKEINAGAGTIRSKYPSYYGVKEGARYYVYNLLEEIDLPGEYFIDRTTGMMYFYMPEGSTENSTIRLSYNASPLIGIYGRSNITVDGLTITSNRGRGISIESNAQSCTVKNCEVSNTAKTAIAATGSGILIENCYVHDTDGGISISGGELSTLTPSGNIVRNCEVENFSRISKTYTKAINIAGVGNTVTNNEIHNGEHMAIGYTGANNVISYNEIYNVCRESDDAGAIYVGRSWTNRGNKITGNYFHDIASEVSQLQGCAGIFFDDHYAGAYIEGNVFENIAGYGVHGNGGRESTVNNNVFINCTKGVQINNMSSQTFTTHYSDLNSSNYLNDVWKEAFPELYNILSNYPEEHRDNVVTNNVTVSCETPFTFGNKVTPYLTNSGNYETDTDPGFADMQGRDYTLTAEAMAGINSAFKTIEFSKMGRQTN